jgi:hypothetical protein
MDACGFAVAITANNFTIEHGSSGMESGPVGCPPVPEMI